MANTQGRCAHQGCQCAVQSGEKYCSTYCAQQTQQTQQSSQGQQQAQSSSARHCNCGHAACQHS